MLAYEAKRISDKAGLKARAFETAMTRIEQYAQRGRTSITLTVTKDVADDLAVKLAELGYAVTLCGALLLIEWGNATNGDIGN